MTGEEPKRRARRKEFRPEEILEAALEEFTRNGYAGTRLEDVAARAGVTKGTIYVYFPGKEQLFREVIRKYQRPLLDDVGQFIELSKTSVLNFLRAYLRFIYQSLQADRECREVLRLIIAEAERFPDISEAYHREVIAPLLGKLREAIALGVERGELRPTAALEFPEIVIAPAALMHLWLLVFGTRVPMDAERYMEAHLELVLQALALPPGGRAGEQGL